MDKQQFSVFVTLSQKDKHNFFEFFKTFKTGCGRICLTNPGQVRLVL